ncbi:MAG: amidase [Saprospiraceae bacterium]|nr:amidase [Saprospiraceae bacterium]
MMFSRREVINLFGLAGLAPFIPVACTKKKSGASASTEVPLHYRTIAEISGMIKSKEISSAELTQLMFDRIEAIDARLHSFITLTKESALASARTLDDELASGKYRGPLHGVPIAVKDLCYTQGVVTMGGLKVRSDFVPDFDGTVVSKLKGAGAVLLGKLNLTEGAMVGYHRDFDIPVNPWGKELWAGVSSSGSGVATAAGLCFGSLGTDTGGSIRFPSMANGIVGLKPTYGRVSRFGVLPLAESLDHVGPMTRSVTDAAIMFAAIAGEDPEDPTSLSAPVPDMLKDIHSGVAGLRIGFDREYALNGVYPGLASAIEEALQVLEGLGAEIMEIKVPDLAGVLEAWPVLCAAEAAEAHQEFFPSRSDEYGTYFREFLEIGSQVSQAQLSSVQETRRAFSDQFRAVLSEVDAMVSPAAGIPYAIPEGLQYGSISEFNESRSGILQTLGISKPPVSFTFPHDFAGTPALALPCGFSDAGFPYTMQLSGSQLSEEMLCQIGHAYETATNWHLMHPPV